MPGGAYPPPEVIASWPKPNYINPETRGPALYITCATLSVIGVLVVAARLYARLFITKAPGFDDVIIVVALLLGIGSSAISIYSTEVLYIGHHAWDVPPAIFPALRLNSWLGQWFSTGMLSAVKISLLLFYRRLSVTFSNRFLWATWIGIIYNIACFIIVAFTISLECRPTAAYWLSFDIKWLTKGEPYACAHIEGIILPVYSAFSVVGDFYSTTLPLCLVYSLQMTRRQKASLYGLFALGYLVVAAGIARTIYVNYVVNQTYDTTWRYYDAILWVTVEFYIALICASAPALKPFFKRFFMEPLTQGSPSRRRRSGYTFGSSGKRYIGNHSDTYLNDTGNDEESWAHGGLAVELEPAVRDQKGDKVGVTVHETNDFFNDRPRHSLIQNENGTNAELYPRTPFRNVADRQSHNSDEPILEPPQTLDIRVDAHPGASIPIPPTPPPPSVLTSRDPSFVTISAFPVPHRRRFSNVTEDEEKGMDDGGHDFKLPLQGTRENSPEDMKPKKPMWDHLRPKPTAK